MNRTESDIDFDVVNQAIADMTDFVSGSGNEKANIVMLPISDLHPHPQNPRSDVGDVTELAASIKAGGLHQNLTVVRGHEMTDDEYKAAAEAYRKNPTGESQAALNKHHLDSGYTVIIGHRRLAACKLAGLTTVPCAIVEMDRKTQIATMLAENMQRVDLTVAEQATSMQLCMDLGDTVDGLAEKTGFSKTTVKHRLELAKLDKTKIPKQITVGEMEMLEKIDSIDDRNELLRFVGTPNLQWNVDRIISKQTADKNWQKLKPEIEALTGKAESATAEYDEQYKRTDTYRDSYEMEKYDFKEKTFQSYYGGPKVTLDEVVKAIKDGVAYAYRDSRLCILIVRSDRQIDDAAAEKERKRKETQEALRKAWDHVMQSRYDYMFNLKPDDTVATLVEDTFFYRLMAGDYREYSRAFDKFMPKHDNTSMESWTAAMKAAKQMKNNKRALWLLAQDVFDYTPFNTYSGEYSEIFQKNNEAALGLLKTIGYEPSDEEQALMDGSSELYAK